MKHKNFHPEICILLDRVYSLWESANLRSHMISDRCGMIDEVTRARAEATANAYAYMMYELRELNWKL
jgi:hypothetical protein